MKRTALALCLGFLSMALWAKSLPVITLEQLTDRVIVQLNGYKKGTLDKKKLMEAIKKEVVVYLDEDTMAKQVVGRYAWQQASVRTRQAFVHEFLETVLASYAHVLADFNDHQLTFQEPRQIKGRYVQVQSSVIALNGQKTEMVYYLHKRGEDWRIYDISVEGVSLVSSYHSQFSHVLINQGLSGLVDMLKQQKKG